MNDDSLVIVNDLRKTYRDGMLRRRRIDALKGVSFEVKPGEVFGLLGPNGAGKTTMIKILLGIVRKSGGSATLLGLPAGKRHGRRRVGYLPENHRIPHHLNGNSALEYYGSLSGVSVSDTKARRGELLSLVGLGEWGKTSVKKYSKGMLQRLGLAQAMLHNPELLILDEPTDGVDPVGRAEIREILSRLKDEGKSIFLNSHMLQEVELVCDRVVILEKGSVRHIGNVEELTAISSTDVVFVLEGEESLLRKSIDPALIASWSPIGGNRYKIALMLNGQSEVNRALDRIRAAGIGICSMTPHRLTLEEAFLQLVRAQSKRGEIAQSDEPTEITSFGDES